ncbi:methylmalonyl-CoA/ethylmalonyl-CoA epimerase [Ruminococcaceae bacterium YRB3002]|nr:methylmalonyl-CoA/ethylmalonyl-CoA epimerase [Ruminococcaceae bacterium YRB3002]
MRVHHIGYLVKRLARSEEAFAKLGYQVERAVKYDHVRDVNISFMKNGDYRVELIEPASKESPLYPLLKNYKNSPYHICYFAEDLEAARRKLESDGFMVIQDTQVAPALDGRNVIFMVSADIGIIELVEENPGGGDF